MPYGGSHAQLMRPGERSDAADENTAQSAATADTPAAGKPGWPLRTARQSTGSSAHWATCHRPSGLQSDTCLRKMRRCRFRRSLARPLLVAPGPRHQLTDGLLRTLAAMQDGVHLFGDGHLHLIACSQAQRGGGATHAFSHLAVQPCKNVGQSTPFAM